MSDGMRLFTHHGCMIYLVSRLGLDAKKKLFKKGIDHGCPTSFFKIRVSNSLDDLGGSGCLGNHSGTALVSSVLANQSQAPTFIGPGGDNRPGFPIPHIFKVCSKRKHSKLSPAKSLSYTGFSKS